jgi:hypothetical protein
MQIDHINGIRDDDRVENLRIVTNRENAQNSKKYRNGGLVGVVQCKNKYRANITINKNVVPLGIFPTAIEANIVYTTACKNVSMYVSSRQFKYFVYDILHGTQSIIGDGIFDFPTSIYKRYRVYATIENTDIYLGSFGCLRDAQEIKAIANEHIAEYCTITQFRALVHAHFANPSLNK